MAFSHIKDNVSSKQVSNEARRQISLLTSFGGAHPNKHQTLSEQRLQSLIDSYYIRTLRTWSVITQENISYVYITVDYN